jgi:hypothetical protein
VTELGDEYKSVERHRLMQDERHERHWKKWGPYVSERQWVSLDHLNIVMVLILTVFSGHRA